MPADTNASKGLMKIHATGAALCVLIAAGAIYFAADSISKRRGLFLSARHELTSTKAELNSAIRQRGDLASQVQRLERLTAENLELISIRELNTRTAEIVALAEKADVRIDSLQPLERIADARVPVQPLALLGSARAEDASALLGALGEQMPDMHIQTIELIGDSSQSATVTLRLVLYWFVDPADAGQ